MPAATTTFTYASDGVETEPSGTGKKETYDVAIALTNKSIVGKVITKITVPIIPSEKVGDISIWLAKELKTRLVGGKNTNIVNKRWNINDAKGIEKSDIVDGVQMVSVTLDKPIVVPEGGLYVGYSVTINDIDRSFATQVPIVTAKQAKDGGFYLRTSRSFLSWKDCSQELGVAAMTKVELSGDLHANAATLGEIPYSYIAVNKEQTVRVPVYNIGQTPITSLQYTTKVGISTYSGTVVLEKPIPAVYAYFEDVEFKVPVAKFKGETTVSVHITGVNGENNEATERFSANGKAVVLKFVPKHLGLVEEFTGTWCGWCPSGYVAMEKMKEIDPEFIGIAYHDRDPMTMAAGYPKLTSGFPTASISREFSTHPYEAMGISGEFSMPQVWDYCCEGFVPVGIDLNAKYENGKVVVDSSVEWVLPADALADDYRVEYVLVADGLSGDTQGWAQHNYFSTEPVMYDYMEQFWHKDTYVRGLQFNDVAIMTSGMKGVKGSITTTRAEVANKYTYTFDTSEALNADGDLIPFHSDKLRVIAFVLTGDDYGTVVNAAQCRVVDPAAIQSPVSENEKLTAGKGKIYTLSGIEVKKPGKGIYIKNGKKYSSSFGNET